MRRRIGKDGRKCRTKKVRYRDEKSAILAMRWANDRLQGDVMPSRVYECEFCHGWHLTSQEERT